MQKQIILDISKELYFSEKIGKKNYLYISSNNEYKRLKTKNSKGNKIYFAIIDFKKLKFSKILNIFILLNNNFKIYKNILIFFELEKEIIAHNFFPDWPGKYKFLDILGSSYFWLKKILVNLVFFKKIKFIVIKFKLQH